MPITALMPIPKQQYDGIAGIPLAGGKIYTYAAGTTTPKVTYTDAAGTIPQTNPIILNVRGEPPSAIFWSGSYKVEVRDGLNNLIYTVDNYNTDPAGVWNILSTLASSVGSSLIGFIQSGVGAWLRTLQDKERERPSILDYIDPAQHAGLRAQTSTYDCLASFNAALVAHQRVLIPGGYRFPVSGTVQVPAGKSLYGEGKNSIIYALPASAVGDLVRFGPDGVYTTGCSLDNLCLSGAAVTACSLNFALNCTLDRIYTEGGTFTNGFKFYYTFPGHFSSLFCNGATISNACFTFLDEVNACVFDNLYTSNFCQHNFFYSGTGHGNTFNNPTAQGGRYGFNLDTTGFFGGIAINGLYTENVAHPVVFGRSNLTALGAIGVSINGATLAGPDITHPQYAECIAAIELNFCRGVVLNGIDFLGTMRTSGGFPTVTITGDGSGALAMARVKPTGEIHSIEVLSPGTGYTVCNAVITGGGGAGATLTVTLAATKVSTIAVTTAGAGYKRLQTPMAIRFNLANNVKISGCRSDTPKNGANATLYPMMVYLPGGQYYNSTIAIDDVSLRTTSTGGYALVQKMSDVSEKFAIVEYDGSGTQVISTYVAPSYP